MNSRLASPAWMISRAIPFASEMSEPTSRPSQTSAPSADDVRRGSTAYSRAPLRTPRRRWWKKIGCVSRAFEPQSTIRSVSSASRYELVPPPAPNTVARPATDGACQVRLQLSMLLLPRTCRESFLAAKLTSLVAFEQLKIPIGARSAPGREPRAAWKPAPAGPSASPHFAAAGPPPVGAPRGGVGEETIRLGQGPPRPGGAPPAGRPAGAPSLVPRGAT